MPPNTKQLSYESDDVELISSYEKKGYRTTPIFFVNGRRVASPLARLARPHQTLLHYLRETLHLTGSKLGCDEGGCGACTVMVSKVNDDGTVCHYSVNACLMPALGADGCHITTVEGIGSVNNKKLHPVQTAMVEMHGSQCGFCTPGIMVSLYTLLSQKNANVAYVEEHLDGNLCRCTGYRPIWDAARSLCDDGAATVGGPCGTPCRQCPARDTCEQDCNVLDKQNVNVPHQHQNGDNDNDTCVVSTSHDKMHEYASTFLHDTSWRQQADQMFPVELQQHQLPELAQPLMVVDRSAYHAGGTWFKPTTLDELLALMKEFGGSNGSNDNCKIVVGNTEVGIEIKFKHAVYSRLIYPADSIRELYSVQLHHDQLIIGSCCSLSTIQHWCRERMSSSHDVGLVRTVAPLHDMLRWFASTQIRNVACLGGNLVTASPISDMNPMLASMKAQLVVASCAASHTGGGGGVERRTVSVADFFLRYRTVDMQTCEVVERIEVPVLAQVFEYLKPFKQARRREDDISIVTSGMRIKVGIHNGTFVIDEIDLAFGGMAPTTKMATATAQAMTGQPLLAETFKMGAEKLLEEFSLPEQVPGGQAAFRMTLAASFLYKFYLSVVEELTKDCEAIRSDPAMYANVGELPALPVVDKSELSGTYNFLSANKPKYRGTQIYPTPKVAQGFESKALSSVKPSKSAAMAAEVGKPVVHQSGPLHVTGEALYTDDNPLLPGTLQAALVLAAQGGGIFESMDVAPALAIAGVEGVYSYETIQALGGSNELGPIVHDELIFLPPGEEIRTVGQVLGVVVAESLEAAELGARMVKVNYGEPTKKIVVTVEDAIEQNSFYEFARHNITRGDVSILDSLASTPDFEGTPSVGDTVKVSGKFSSGAQEHFYLETNSTLVVPSEGDTNLTIYCSTQATNKTQMFCASATGTPASKTVVRMKRMGGGFGGKETRSVFVSCAAAVAAKATNRPVRLTLSRAADMKLTGTRHVFVSKYQARVKITEAGPKLEAMDIKLFANAGNGFDLSGPVVDRALFHSDGCYFFPHFRAEGVPCKTVQPAHTAFRGFGGPQGMAVVEHVMDHVAMACGVSLDDFRRTNMYKPGDHTPFGMIMEETGAGRWNVPRMWDKLAKEVNVERRRAEVAAFNAQHRWIKRGVSFGCTRFGIAFTAKYMNQGGALVHLYQDGTVLVSHGGTEMGQGLSTKVCQVTAQAFGIPVEDVYVNDSSSDKVANAIPTAASMSTDLYGMAALDASRQILKRLEPIYERLGSDAKLKDVAKAAHMDRIDLSAHGFFTVPSDRCGYVWDMDKPADFPGDKPENSWKGHPFNYFTQGVVFCEVEVDLLTGTHRTIQADLLVDVGSSVNPAIDIGQIEGAFIQGMGWCTIEEVIYADDDHTWIKPRGTVFTTGPGTYKIPAFNDVPETFNVSLMDDVDNPFAVHSSKAVGEPPFYLGSGVYYAIKDAVRAARKDNLGDDKHFEFRMPATSERIRMYCADPFAGKAVAKVKGEAGAIKSFQPQGSY